MSKRLMTVLCCCALCLVIAGTPLSAQDMDELAVDHALTFEFSTPHTDWAQPYARGTTRVLFFTDGRGTKPRECVEVMQRFDIRAEAVFWAQIVDSPETHWHGADVGERRMLKLLEEDWDCYVFLGLSMANMSPEQQYKVLSPVAEGAGIVFVGANDERILKEPNLLAEAPPFIARGPVGDAYTVGKGRGMRLPARPDIGYYEGWEVDYDYWAQRLGRAILWSANKEPALLITAGLSADKFPARGAGGNLTIAISGAPIGADPILETRLRRHAEGGSSFQPVQASLADGKASMQFANVNLPADKYWFDVRLRSSKGVEGWDSAPFEVVSERGVDQVKLHQAWGEIGDYIAGEVILKGDSLPGETLRVRLLDSRRRELAHRDVRPAQDTTEFNFPIERWMPMLLTVEAQLLQGPGELSRNYTYFHVTKRNRGQFNFLMWDTPRGTLAPYAERSLAENSVTLQLGGGPPPIICAANDVAWVPYTTRIMNSKTEEGIMKPFCWNDEQAVQKYMQEKAQAYLAARHHGVFVWSLGDEVHTLGACLSEHCAKAYRDYLKGQYGTLEALNTEWGTQFAQWHQVGLSEPDDSQESTAKLAGNYPRWFDRQAFRSWNFVQFCQKYARAYEAIDPEAKTGFEGAGLFGRGDDLDLIIRSNKFWSPYPGTADEVVRSIAPREFPRANWMGYTKDAGSLLQKYWRMVTRGTDAVWWWRWDCIGRFHGWLAPDLRPYPAVKEILKDTQFVRDGLGDLLLKSQMLDDGIAVLYSYPSTFATKLEEGPSYGGYESAHLATHDMIRELRLQFRYVTDRMLRLGEFDAAKYKLLVLPRAEALGDQEAQVIRRFVRDGGHVIADVRPGIYDGHCKPREEGVLDDLFGIKRAAPAEATVADAESLGALKVDSSVGLSSAQSAMAVDGTPIMVSRQVGAGSAYLANFDLSTYPKLSVADTPEGAAQGIADLIEAAGVSPPCTVIDAQGARVRNLEMIRWQDGGIEIIALFRSGGEDADATVTLPQAGYVYDLRNRKALGKVSSFPTRILANRAGFFAVCPQPAPKPQMAIDADSVTRGTVLTASLSVPGAQGLHALRIRATVDGRHLQWLDQNVIAGQSAVEFDLPIAYNDPIGEYTISAIDLFSNEPVVTTFTVR